MMKFVKNFRNDESGAVTVDWVVLTAAVVGLAIAAYGSIQGGATQLTSDTSTFLSGNSAAIGTAAGLSGTAVVN